MENLSLLNSLTTLRRVRNPSAPSAEEVWQSLRDYRAGIPERQERWRQAALASQETLAQVELHEPSSRDTLQAYPLQACSSTYPFSTAHLLPRHIIQDVVLNMAGLSRSEARA